jgi:hypothetical protein
LVDPMEPDETKTPPLREDDHPESEEMETPLSERERRRRHADEVQILRDAEGKILLANADRNTKAHVNTSVLTNPNPNARRELNNQKQLPHQITSVKFTYYRNRNGASEPYSLNSSTYKP